MVAASTLKPRDLGFVFVVASYQKKFLNIKFDNIVVNIYAFNTKVTEVSISTLLKI